MTGLLIICCVSSVICICVIYTLTIDIHTYDELASYIQHLEKDIELLEDYTKLLEDEIEFLKDENRTLKERKFL